MKYNFEKRHNFEFKIVKHILLIVLATISISAKSQVYELYVGTAEADITPQLPVALQGQMHLRIAHTAKTPLSATVIALESRDGTRFLDQAIMVSCDLTFLPLPVIQMVRDEVHRQLPKLDVNKIVLNATHTHTAPVIDNGPEESPNYAIPKEGVLQPEQYRDFLVEQVSKAIVKAWKNRNPCSVSWGLSHAVVGYNRRPVYADGTAMMYGNTRTPEFRNIEAMEDHDVNVLFFWNKRNKLIATAVNLSCPAQEAENDYEINADFWHPARQNLKKRFGKDLCVLGWTSAAGDISTRPMYRKTAEERMIKLRELSQLEEMGRRVTSAVEEAYETVREDRFAQVQLIHKVEHVKLPLRLVTGEEYLYCKNEMEKASAKIAADPKEAEQILSLINWNKGVVDRYERQKTNPHPETEIEVHVLRLGDVAICTSEFELYTNFGVRIQARSNALQTFYIQLAGNGSYLATETATRHGSYGAIIQSSTVSPEGGQILVDRTVEMINSMFATE